MHSFICFLYTRMVLSLDSKVFAQPRQKAEHLFIMSVPLPSPCRIRLQLRTLHFSSIA